MPFGPGNEEWRKRRVCRGGAPTKKELARRKIEKQERDRVIRAYAEVETARIMKKLLGIKDGVCPLCERTA